MNIYITRKKYRNMVMPFCLLNFIANLYIPKYFGITTSLNVFAKSLMRNKNWMLISMGRKINAMESLRARGSGNRNTYSFRYSPNIEGTADV